MGERIHAVKQVEFKVDTDRLLDVATLDETIAISEMFSIMYDLQNAANEPGQLNMLAYLSRIPVQLKAGRALLCKLVWDTDHYLSPDEASPIVGEFSLRQIFDTVSGILNQINVSTTGDEETGSENSVE